MPAATARADQALALQTEILDLERAVPTRAFSPGVLPGALQTEEVARAVITLSGAFSHATHAQVEDAVALRMRRGAALRDGGPHRAFVVTGMALGSGIVDTEVMQAQLTHLDEVAALPHVDLRILPKTAAVAWTLGFTIRAGHTTVEGEGGILRVPVDDTPHYEAAFARYRDASVPYLTARDLDFPRY